MKFTFTYQDVFIASKGDYKEIGKPYSRTEEYDSVDHLIEEWEPEEPDTLREDLEKGVFWRNADFELLSYEPYPEDGRGINATKVTVQI